MASKALRNNFFIIKFISTLEHPRLLRAILKTVDRDFWDAISELVYNCLYGPVDFTLKQKSTLTPFKHQLKVLASKRKSIKLRRKVLIRIGHKVLKPIVEAVSVIRGFDG
jgi:hypothetical protein